MPQTLTADNVRLSAILRKSITLSSGIELSGIEVHTMIVPLSFIKLYVIVTDERFWSQ